LVDLTGASIDLLGAPVVDRLPGQGGDLASEAPAVEPDQGREPLTGRRETRAGERLEPGGDPRLDSVDERAVEVEQDRGRER